MDTQPQGDTTPDIDLTMITCTACGAQFFDGDDQADHALDQHG